MKRQPITLSTLGLLAILAAWNAPILSAQPPTERDEREIEHSRLADLERQVEMHRQSLATIQKRIADEQNKLKSIQPAINERESVIQKLDQELFEASFSLLSFPDVLATLQTMRVHLKIDLAGTRAKLQVLRELNDKGNPAAAINEQKLVIAREMLELTKNRLNQMKNLYEKGNVPQQEAQAAEVEVRNAELRVIEAQAALEASRSDSSIANREIILQQAEQESKLAEVESLLKSAATARQTIREIESQQQAAEKARMEQQESAKKLERLESQLESEARTLEQMNAVLEENRRHLKK